MKYKPYLGYYNRIKNIKTIDEFKNKYPGEFKSARKKGILNELFPGGIHLFDYWDIDKITKILDKYKALQKFKKENKLLTYVIEYNNWSHLLYKPCLRIKVMNKYMYVDDITKEIAEIVVKQYKGRSEFKVKNYTLFDIIISNGWEYIINDNLTYQKHKPYNYWSLEQCRVEALKYETDRDFVRGSCVCRQRAMDKGYYDEISGHFKTPRKPYWDSKKRCEVEAKKYKSIYQFSKHNQTAYGYSARNDWLDEFFPNKKINKEKGYWDNIENCRIEAKKYKKRTDFTKGNQYVYVHCIKHGWLDDVCSHMVSDRKPLGYWNNKSNMEKEIEKYDTILDFAKDNKRLIDLAIKNNWNDLIFKK